MSIAAVAGGIKVGQSLLSGLNAGACGKKCYGIGRTLRRCRENRDKDCERQKTQAAIAQQQEILRQRAVQEARRLSNQTVTPTGAMAATSGTVDVKNLGIIAIVVAVVFLLITQFR